MRRGAPYKEGLDFFPKMVSFYEDDKIFDLLDEYGPLGVTIYDCILTIIYSNGYYVSLSKDKLSRMVIQKIGNKWIKGKKVVVQVIDRCADLGLFDKDLMLQDIITSVGIQERYYEIAVKRLKRQLHNTKYWLLKNENGKPLLSAPLNPINPEENRINSELNAIVTEESATIKEKEGKENINLIKQSGINPEENLEEALARFEKFRWQIRKPLTAEGKELLREELCRIGKNDRERVAILNQSIMNGWSGIYPPRKEKPKNAFHNFKERDEVDYDALVLAQLQRQGKEG